MQIRELTPDDAPALTALYHTYEWWDDREADRVRASIEGADAVLGLVGEGAVAPDGDLVGTARIITDGIYYGRIYDVMLAPSVRGRSHGEDLVRAAREHPSLDGVNTVTLSCREGLVPFYERCGFERHDGTYEVGGEEEPAHTMVAR